MRPRTLTARNIAIQTAVSRGEPLDLIAERFGLKRGTVYAIISRRVKTRESKVDPFVERVKARTHRKGQASAHVVEAPRVCRVPDAYVLGSGLDEVTHLVYER